jgi:two-component system cell cycle sensor histidine kinase PleC
MPVLLFHAHRNARLALSMIAGLAFIIAPGTVLAAAEAPAGAGGALLPWIGFGIASMIALALGYRLKTLREESASQSAEAPLADKIDPRLQELEAEREKLKAEIEALILSASEAGKARDDAEAANHAKTQFLAMMSHELRTALNAILGFSEIIRSEALGPVGFDEYRIYAADIYTSGAHLLSVINDLLDLAKVESGMVDLRDELVDPASIVDETVRIVSKTEAARNIRILSQPDADTPNFRGDKRRMRQILLSLATNAAKFTPADGTVCVRAYQSADGGVVMETSDTGIGIPADDLERVMQPFVQLDNQLTREYHGTGLGLPLCKQLAELHGGSFEIESAVNEGTTVRVTMPPSRTVQKPQPKPAEAAA